MIYLYTSNRYSITARALPITTHTHHTHTIDIHTIHTHHTHTIDIHTIHTHHTHTHHTHTTYTHTIHTHHTHRPTRATRATKSAPAPPSPPRWSLEWWRSCSRRIASCRGETCKPLSRPPRSRTTLLIPIGPTTRRGGTLITGEWIHTTGLGG